MARQFIPSEWEDLIKQAGEIPRYPLAGDRAVRDAIRAGEDAHILTIGSPTRGLCFRMTLGRLDRSGKFHNWQPNAFFIWRGKRVSRA